MAAQYTRADALREYLTGAASAGGVQADPLLSLGNHRSSTETKSFDLSISPAPVSFTIDFASGANGQGAGQLQIPGTGTLLWKAPGEDFFGPPAAVSGSGVVAVVEGYGGSGKYVRVTATTPLTPDLHTVTLADAAGGYFGTPDLSAADATAGKSHYRASIIKNQSSKTVSQFRRWIGLLGTARMTDTVWLGGSGTGNIQTSGSLADWPDCGWAQIRNSAGTLKEIVYYTSRTATTITVSDAGHRGLLGTSATAGTNTDMMYPVPGIAISYDADGVTAAGNAIAVIANSTTVPAGVAWKTAVSPVHADALAAVDLPAGYEVGIWIWRHVPPGVKGTPSARVLLEETYNAY